MHPNQASNKTKPRKKPQKNRKGASNVTEDVEGHEELDDEEEELRTDTQSYPRPKNSRVIPDEEQGSESGSEEDEEDEGRVLRVQVNSAAATTRPPLAPHNRRAEDEHERREHDELQEKYRKLREALRDSQTEVAQLKQRGKEKRKHLGDKENGDQNKMSKKQKTKAKDADDRETHVRDLGKRFAPEYVLWVDARIIFIDSDSDRQGVENNEGGDNDAGNNDEALATREVRVPLAEPTTGWTLKTPEGIDQYTRFQVRKFKQTLEPKDLRNWDRKWFKKEFCEGARKFRSDILKGLATRPIEVFGLKDVTAVKFMDKNGRPELPEVQELLKSDSFLLGDNPGLTTERIYRNECIVRILLRIYSGPEAVITGVRSRMAHKTYGSKFKPTTITFVQLALAAVVAKVILEGDAEFTDANADRVDWYWKRLDFLYQIKSKKPHYIDPTIKYLNKRLGFGVEEEPGEELNELEQAMLAELEDY